MSDRELWNAAWKELTLTTDSYPTWKKKGFPASSHWAKAKALGDQIGAVPPPPATVPFGSWPAFTAPGRYTGKNDVNIVQKSVSGPFEETLSFEGCHNVTIDADLISPKARIYLLSCTGTLNLKVRTKGCGRNIVQLDKCVMDGLIDVEGIGGSNTEDMVSINASGGPDEAHPLRVRYRLEGKGWTSASGSGIMTEENPGWVTIEEGTMLNPGQVGIGVHGPEVKVIGPGKLYSDGKMAPVVRVGVDCADPASAGCTVTGLQVDWRNSGGGYQPYSTLTNPYPKGWAGNDWQWRATAAELAAMKVVL